MLLEETNVSGLFASDFPLFPDVTIEQDRREDVYCMNKVCLYRLLLTITPISPKTLV